MSFFVKSSQGGVDFQPVDAGTYIGRLYMLVDLGTKDTEWQGKKRKRHTVRLGWELPTEMKDFGRGKLEPAVVGKTYTLSLGSKDKPSALRADLEAWRGKPFTDQEAENFDIGRLVGVPAMLTVSHRAKTGGGMAAVVAGVGKTMKGLECPPAILPTVVYQTADGNSEAFQALPQWLKDEIQKSDEWIAGFGAGAAPVPPDGEVHDDKAADDIPF